MTSVIQLGVIQPFGVADLPDAHSQVRISYDMGNLARVMDQDYGRLRLRVGGSVSAYGAFGVVLSRIDYRAWCGPLSSRGHEAQRVRPSELIAMWIDLIERDRIPSMVPVLWHGRAPCVRWVAPGVFCASRQDTADGRLAFEAGGVGLRLYQPDVEPVLA